jgi:hypothetical protein
MFVETSGVTDKILHSEVFVSATKDKFLPSVGWFYRWLIISLRPDNCTHCCLSQATLLLLAKNARALQRDKKKLSNLN